MPGTNAQTTGSALPTTDRGEVQVVGTGAGKARSNSALGKIKDSEFKVSLGCRVDSVPSETSYCVQFCFQGYRQLLSRVVMTSELFQCSCVQNWLCVSCKRCCFLLKNSGIFA